MLRRLVSGAVTVGLVTVFGSIGALPSSASGLPSGQRMFGGATFDAASGHFVGGGGTIEPAYDDSTGTLLYIQTPNGPHVQPAEHINPATGMPVNVAPLYLPVQPVGSGIDPASLNCAHKPADNCPDHGPGIAGAAMSIVPPVYGAGVLGHDHLIGIRRSTGGDFNILWEPVLVLFTNAQAAKVHITTLAQINAAVGAGDAFEVALPQLDFSCSVVSAAAYDRATPAPTVVGLQQAVSGVRANGIYPTAPPARCEVNTPHPGLDPKSRLRDGTPGLAGLCLHADILGLVVEQRGPYTNLSLEISVRFIQVPNTSWVLQEIEAWHVADGYAIGPARLWDERGNLCAIVSQTAQIRPAHSG